MQFYHVSRRGYLNTRNIVALIFNHGFGLHRQLQYLVFASLDSFLHHIDILLLSNFFHISDNWLLP